MMVAMMVAMMAVKMAVMMAVMMAVKMRMSSVMVANSETLMALAKVFRWEV